MEFAKPSEPHRDRLSYFDMSPLGKQCDATDVELIAHEKITQQDFDQIWRWNRVAVQPIERCVHEIFEERAQEQPNALAICSWDGEILYGELNQFATRLAIWLKIHRVGSGVLVPLLFHKSMWTTVAMLGVLKAGGGFVLLDPSLPEHRLQGIVQQVKADLILSSVSNTGLGSRLARDVMTVDRDVLMRLNDQGSGQLPSVSCSSVMCLNFTSGSTGTPKGALLTHRNYASALYHQAKCLGFTTESRIYDFSSYSFDASVGQTFTALAAGACLCVPREQDRENNLAQSITSLRANVVALTPSVARLLHPNDTPTLQSLLFIGERLCSKDIERWWGKVRVLNIYGPSECTPYSVIKSHASCPQEATRIGTGVGVVTWVVQPENHDHLLPIGETGELLLEGPLVGEGYLNEPEKTAMAFIHSPTWLKQGAPGIPGRCGTSLYKTGDLVHYNEDGTLTYVGRKDTQVKIHGQRAELAEIEHYLHEHIPGAKQIVAENIMSEGESSGPVLAAFVQRFEIWREAGELEPVRVVKMLDIPDKVKDKLYQYLPGYMVPTIFFSVREFPLTVTTKLDRRRLREIGTSCFQEYMKKHSQDAKPSPQSGVGLELQRILGRALSIDPDSVGLEDNFFRLGGDSITAMRVVSEAQKAEIQLTVSDIFQCPTLSSLSSRCHIVVEKAPEIIPPYSLFDDGPNKDSLLQEIGAQYELNPAAMEDAYPCTPLQEGFLSLSSNRQGEYMIQLTLELRPTIEISDFYQAWGNMTRNVPILRTRIVYHNSLGHLQLVLNEEIQWGHAKGLDRFIQEDRKIPMDLGKSLARYTLVTDTSSKRRWFVWTLHHAVYDGWSLPLMIDMVNQAYRGIPIKPPKCEFKSFVKYIGEQDNQRTEEYWRKTFADCDCIPFPSLPSYVPCPVADSTIMHQIPWLSTRSGDVTTSTLVRAAWALLTSCMTNSDNVVFGVTTSGRSAPLRGIDEIIGPTIATVPFYIKTIRSQRALDYLAGVQQQATEMTPFEQFGLHRIAKTSPEAQQSCMFQTLLMIQPGESDHAEDTLGEWEENHEPEWVNTFALSLEVKIGMNMVNARFDSKVIKPWVVQTLLHGLEFVMKQLDNAGFEHTIADIEFVTPESLEQIWDWNRIVPTPVKTRVHDMIEKSVQNQPLAMAISSWDGQLTYGELDRLATALADHLVKFGVGPQLLGPDILVPLCFEKSKWAVVSMLGVLKAGAGFVLLDPSLPEPRLKSIVGTVGAKLLLSSHANLDLSTRLSEMVVQIGPDLSHLPDPASFNAMSAATQARPSARTMYAVFTSGSTGAPKGVLVSHESFCSAVEHQLKILGFNRESRVLDFASYAFDAAVHNAMATLVAGGCLCIPSEKGRKDNIGNIMATMRPTIANLTPTVARLLDPGAVHDLKKLILLGEPVTTRDAERWRSYKVDLVNAYGPAECTPISTINAHISNAEEASRIGKGVGLVTWIVSPEDHNQLLLPGCTGELLLEGPLVGDGYMRNPERTAEVFVESPRWLLKGSLTQSGRHGRLYKTGDLVQYNEDGSLTFMCRKDTQVKIRGQRFELEEVEHHILACLPPERSLVATEIVLPEGESHLKPVSVAFIQVGRKGTKIEEETPFAYKQHPMATDIKKKLALQLPSYMIPTVFFAVPDIPLTVTGKTDRRRLRHMGQELLSVKGKQEYCTPEQSFANETIRDSPILETEQPAHILAQKIYSMRPSWSQHNPSFRTDESQSQRIELSDIFLHSSGLDSVNMMELASFISQKFHVQVGMQYLMAKATTIRDLAQYVTEAQDHKGRPIGGVSTHANLITEINRHDTRVLTAQRELAGHENITHNNSLMNKDTESSTVFLTGATGFIGTQILRQLLEDCRVSRVICLVRGETDDAARHRAIEKAVQALWWTTHHAEKLEVWRGDLSLPHLGLDPTRWNALSSGQAVNSIIHSGATVHWTKNYQVLDAANVGSTIELVLLTLGLPCMRFLYITGGRQWDPHEELDVVKELSVPDAIPYSQTKFVAEVVVRRAARRRLSGSDRLAVMNPGWVIGTPTEGFSNAEDYIWRLVAACIRIGAYNVTEADGWLSITDVTTTATAVIDAASSTEMKSDYEKHTTDGMTWREFWTIIADLGYRLKAKSEAEWLSLVRADIDTTRNKHPLWPLAHLVETLQNDERVAGSSLEKRGITPLQLRTAVSRSAKYLISVGLLPRPAEKREMAAI
ncbi:hypothetical protein N7457_003818 [Penicillium paradoxum]|uniref:uncharacterized protein n=1 Tax=Penicillium paradoxum TaxID=176176 RepID=UPI002547C8DB|nr:uncharacterized protein N7457_003818 [Penicillium paradoxum]KAJ5782044.1 hypothetical protein N7457_003818 [Penicillium paradoxum]